jgi:predicted O-linked N-acetylglucosamine transferase (SPINDLY family)
VYFIPAARDEAINRARYALLDMALDTFPYSGGDTTLAALDMGVPVVTLCGQRHSERTSYSILMNLGVPQTIAHSEGEFVEIACRLANDMDWRDTMAAQIRRGMKDSMLVDMDGYTRNLEDACRRAIAACPLKEGGETDDNNQALFRESVRHHQAGRLADAVTAYRQVLANQPEHAAALYLYGMLLKQLGQDDEAIDNLRQAIASSPGYLDAYQALGNLYLKQDRIEEAIASFNRALKLKPGHSAALNGLGRALIQAGRMAQAIITLRQAVASQPQEPSAHFNLGVAYQHQGKLDAAEIAFRRVLALDPHDIEARRKLDILNQEKIKTRIRLTPEQK